MLQARDETIKAKDRFLSSVEIDNKLQRSREKEVDAKDIISASEKSYKNKVNYYNDAIGAVQGSYLYLKESVSYLKEIVRLIKTEVPEAFVV